MKHTAMIAKMVEENKSEREMKVELAKVLFSERFGSVNESWNEVGETETYNRVDETLEDAEDFVTLYLLTGSC